MITLSNDITWPSKTREIQDFLMDSTHWNDFQFRNDDIVIAAYSKSGTTWVQQIISQLIFNGDANIFGQTLSPWIDFQLTPDAPEIAKEQTHRRFMKTHLPLDALVFSPRAKYIYVGRDARDVIWSLHHFLMSFTPIAFQKFGEIASRLGYHMPPIPRDVGDFYRYWLHNDISSPNSFWKHVKGWWAIRNLPNILFIHYANLKMDLASEFRRIAKFLNIPINEEKFLQMLEHCSLSHMKDRAAHQEFLKQMFQDEGRTFINQGTNGRWHNVLSTDEIAKCDEIAKENLSHECAHWLKTGETLL